MRIHIIPAAAAAVLSFASLALAASPQHATGTIKTYDAKAMTLTLSDGSVYMLSKTFKDPGLKAGEKVNVAWNTQGKEKMADTVKIVK